MTRGRAAPGELVMPGQLTGQLAGQLAGQPQRTGGARTVRSLVAELAERLKARGVEEPEREARDMVAAVADVSRFWPTLHPHELLDAGICERATAAAARRASGAPFAYAVGRAAFRHLTLEVDERVLIPRQETEQLVELVLQLTSDTGGTAVDIGTGSGAIALSLASEGNFERVIATDISLGALAVARGNLARLRPTLRSDVVLRAGSLLAPLRGARARAIISNPPYIAASEAGALPRTVRDWEPPIALFGGVDGMHHTAAIVRDAAPVLEPRGLLALEVDERRAACAAELASASGYYTKVRVCADLTGRDRILLAERNEA